MSNTLIVWIVIAAIIAVIPAEIARRKGYSFFWFYVFGLFLWILALPTALLAKRRVA